MARRDPAAGLCCACLLCLFVVLARGCGAYEVEHVGDDARRGVIGYDVSAVVAVLVAGRRCRRPCPIGPWYWANGVTDRIGLSGGEVWPLAIAPARCVTAIVRVETAAVVVLEVEVGVATVLLCLTRRHAAATIIFLCLSGWDASVSGRSVVGIVSWRALGDAGRR